MPHLIQKLSSIYRVTYLLTALLIFLTIHPTFSQNFGNPAQQEDLYESGWRLLQHRNMASARSTFEQYLQEYPDGIYSQEAEYYAAYSALVLYHADGEKLMKNFVDQNPVHPKAILAYYELGKFYYNSRNYLKATEYLSKARLTELDPKLRNEAVFMLAYSYFARRSLDEALPYFNQVKNGNSTYSPPASYYAGYIEFEQEKYRDAVQDFSRAENNDSYASEIPYMKASALYRLESYDEMISYTQEKIASGKSYSNGQILYLLTAEAYFKKKDYKMAYDYYEEYRNLVRGGIERDVLYRIAYTQYELKDDEAAIQSFKTLADRGDELGIHASYYLGILYVRNDNKRFAVTAFDNVRANGYDNKLALEAEYHYARLQFELGNDTQAISAMESFISDYQGEEGAKEYVLDLNELLSEAYLSTNDYQKAVRHIEKQPRRSNRLNKAYQKANYLLGTQYFNKGDYRRAVDLFEKSSEYPIDPEIYVEASFWTAEAYSVGKRWEEAQEKYLIVINQGQSGSSYVSRAKYGLAYTYYNSSEYSKAKEQFLDFIQLNPKVSSQMLSDAYVRLADCYYVDKDYSAAISQYQKGLSLNKSNADYIYLQLGMVNGLQEDLVSADGFFDRVISQGMQSPYFDDALFQKAQLKFNNTDYKESITLFTRLINSKPSSRYVPYALIRRASAFYNIENINSSIDDYKRIFNTHINHPVAKDALIPLQELLTTAGKEDEYDQYLNQYKAANPDEKGLETIEFETSKNQYLSQNYEKAISGLKQFLNDYPQDARREEAIFYIGDAYYRLKNMDNALEWLIKLKENTSFWQYPKVMERLAAIADINGDYSKSASYWRKVESLSSNKRQQNDARSGMMVAYFKESTYDSAIFFASKILESGGTDVNIENKASLYLGKSYFAQGKYEQAKDEFLNTTNKAKDAYGAEAQFLLGQIFYNQKDYRRAIDILIDLNEKYPSFLNWVGKGFLLISDSYRELEDYFQAKGTLNSLIEYFPEEEVKEQARTKLKEIEELENQKREELDALSTDSITVDSTSNGGQ